VRGTLEGGGDKARARCAWHARRPFHPSMQPLTRGCHLRPTGYWLLGGEMAVPVCIFLAPLPPRTRSSPLRAMLPTEHCTPLVPVLRLRPARHTRLLTPRAAGTHRTHAVQCAHSAASTSSCMCCCCRQVQVVRCTNQAPLAPS
jgi:hypothetical protein